MIVTVLTVSRGRRVITRTAIHNYLTLLPDEWTMAKSDADDPVQEDRMVRRLLVGLMAAGLLLAGGPPAFAEPPVTETIQHKNLVDTFVDVLPSCQPGGPLYTFTVTINHVEHSTTFADGRIHGGVTQTGTFVAVPLADPSLPTYTGTFVVHNGFTIQNGPTVNTFTYSAHGTGSDGSTFDTHLTLHINVPPAAPINEFFRCH
ncbi:MAG: hypothetical protein ACRDVN_15860 [Jiangellaceae bacterium]